MIEYIGECVFVVMVFFGAILDGYIFGVVAAMAGLVVRMTPVWPPLMKLLGMGASVSVFSYGLYFLVTVTTLQPHYIHWMILVGHIVVAPISYSYVMYPEWWDRVCLRYKKSKPSSPSTDQTGEDTSS